MLRRVVPLASSIVLLAGSAAAAPTISSIRTGAIASSPAKKVTPPAGHFVTVPPGAALPSDSVCAAQVRPAPEVRALNDVPNHTVGIGDGLVVATGQHEVTGNRTGTTDELIQWAACKWGIDEDIVRAQISKESWWHQEAGGDFTSDKTFCYPAVQAQTPCPESLGLGQVRYHYHGAAFADGNAYKSSAYNLDYTYAIWRQCFNGEDTWLNTVDRGGQYVAGDAWGCLGVWFSGRWLTADANTYIAAVKDYLATRVWESANFKAG